jgi:hypothetical protein
VPAIHQVDLEHPRRVLAGAGQGAVGDQQDLFLVLLDLGPLALVDLEVLEGDLVDAELLAQGGQLLRARRDRLDPDEGALPGAGRRQVRHRDVLDPLPVEQRAHLDHGRIVVTTTTSSWTGHDPTILRPAAVRPAGVCGVGENGAVDGRDVLEAAGECQALLGAAVDRDWTRPIPEMDWTVAQAVTHMAEGTLWYATDLAAGQERQDTMELRGGCPAHRGTSVAARRVIRRHPPWSV